MKRSPWVQAMLLTLASSVIFGVACGGSDKNNDPAPAAQTSTAPTGDTSTATPGPNSGTALGETVNCEDSWKKYVALHPSGLLVNYATVSETKGGSGEVIQATQSTYEDKVQEANDGHVLSTRTTVIQGLPQPVVSKLDFTKSQFLLGCDKVN